jgi:signal peptide peptidase SppA
MNILARIADRVIGRPLLVHPAKIELIASVLAERIGVDASHLAASRREFVAGGLASLAIPLIDMPAANRLVGDPVMAGRQVLYNRVNGVAVIPVVGTLVNRGVAIGEDSSGFTSYESIGAQLQAALADPQAQSILLDIESAGGEASGMYALTQAIRVARAQKPVTALVNDMAASAAYGIAASATDTVVSPTSITGSIGVVLMHLDQSAEMQAKGRKPTLIFAGAHKVDGNPFGPLSENVRADLQREVDTFYARFVDQVAAGRSKLTADAIRSTEARIYIGSEAIDVGLADRVGTFEETLSRLSSAIRARTQLGGPIMSTAQIPEMVARADHDAALATARNEARAEGEAAGRTQAIARVRTILTSPEAEGREAQARVFALDSDMSPEVAAKALAASPTGKAPVPPLDARGNPAPLAGGTAATPKADASTSWDRSLKRAGAKLPA